MEHIETDINSETMSNWDTKRPWDETYLSCFWQGWHRPELSDPRILLLNRRDDEMTHQILSYKFDLSSN